MDLNQTDTTSLVVRKSNDLISAKYKSTLLENQIMSIAMTRIEIDHNNEMTATLYPGELRRLTGRGNNLYTELRVASKSMIGHGIVVEDGCGNFKAFNIVTNAEYENGVFKIKFNEEIRPHILELRSNYTSLNLAMINSFKKNASFRIYELLRKELYRSKASVNDGGVEVIYNISELKFMLALANMDETAIQRELAANNSGHIDWDYLYEIAHEKSHAEWRDLRRHVIIPAQQELAEKSDIRFDFFGIRQGVKYRSVRFIVYPNIPDESLQQTYSQKIKILNESSAKNMHQYSIQEVNHTEFYEKYRGHNRMTDDDLAIIMEKAGQDEKIAEQAISMADRQPEIHNYIGWILKCIENGYSETAVVEGSCEQAERIQNLKEEMHSDDVQQSVWRKIQTNADFTDFLDYLGLTLDQFDLIYQTSGEKAKTYLDWKVGRI